MFRKRPRFARLAAGVKRAGFIVAVCTGVLVMFLWLALVIGSGP